MNSVNKRNVQESEGKKALTHIVIFPVCVLVSYGILCTINPNKALMALKISGNILLYIALPLAFVFMVMLVLNLFVNPAQIARLFGKGVGIKAIVLSVVAGIISMGPIYAWYPLLKNIREEGAGNGPIAIFLYSRAVKPFLLPIMIAYFGWVYVVILTLLTIVASIAIGCFMSVFMKRR